MSDVRSLALINRQYRELNPLDFGEQHCAPGHTYGPAIRKYTLIHFVVSGKGVFTDPRGTYEVRTGEAFIIRPGEVTVYAADREEPWHYIWVGFDGTLSARFAELPSVFRSIPHIDNKLREAFGLCGTPEAYLAGRLFELYARLFDGKKGREDYILQIENYVETNYNGACDVADVAEAVGLERHYLARLFKQKTGGTLKSYITDKRMTEARLLLEQGYAVGHAAQMVGYSDAFVFSKMFKKKFGSSPGAVRSAKKTNNADSAGT